MKVAAYIIKKALSKKHNLQDDFFLTEVKNGPTQMVGRGELLVLDALAIKKSWTQPRITGYEIKISRSDFLSDNKWPGYLKYCHHFSFVCPKKLIQPEELPEEVGLVWYDPDKDSLYTRKKAAFRDIEISTNMLWYIIICRLDSDRHPFFSSDREYYEAWVADRIERRKLGFRTGTKLERELEKAIQEREKAKSLANQYRSQYRSDIETLEQIERIAREAGIPSWNLVKGIEEALKGGVNTRIEAKVNAIVKEAEMLKNMLSKSG